MRGCVTGSLQDDGAACRARDPDEQLLRDLAVVVLMGLVVRDVLHPDEDVVRRSWPGVDDPAGGPLDGADDRVVRRRGARSAAHERHDQAA